MNVGQKCKFYEILSLQSKIHLNFPGKVRARNLGGLHDSLTISRTPNALASVKNLVSMIQFWPIYPRRNFRPLVKYRNLRDT